MKTKLHIYYKYVGGLGPAPSCPLVGGSVSVNLQGYRLIGYVGLSVEFQYSLGPSVLPPTLSQDSPSSISCVAVGLCICFHQLLGRASQRTVILGSCLQAKQRIINSVRDWFLPMGLKLGSQVWPAIGWPFSVSAPSLSLFHLCPCTSCSGTNLGSKVL